MRPQALDFLTACSEFDSRRFHSAQSCGAIITKSTPCVRRSLWNEELMV